MNGYCIAGIDINTGEWIRPINAKSHGAFADPEITVIDGETQKRRLLKLLDILHLRPERYVGNSVQPENWEIVPASYDDAWPVLGRFDGRQSAGTLTSYLDHDGPLLHTYSSTVPADDLFAQKLSHSLSIIRPVQPYWKVGPHPTYPDRLRVEADFCFDGDKYLISVTDPTWEARCRRSGPGRHPHSTIAGDSAGPVFLTISLAEVPLNGYHYKLVAGVVNLPA
jgi:hypothetical protein